MTPHFWPQNDKNARGVLPEKLGGDVRHASWNPYPISDQNLWFSLPYFRPEALEPGAWPERVTSCYGTNTVVGVTIKREMVLSPNNEEVANSSKNIPNSRLEGTNHTLFQAKTAGKNTPFGAAHTHIAYIRNYSPPPPGGRKTCCRLWVIKNMCN